MFNLLGFQPSDDTGRHMAQDGNGRQDIRPLKLYSNSPPQLEVAAGNGHMSECARMVTTVASRIWALLTPTDTLWLMLMGTA